MKTKSSLLGGAALGVLLAASMTVAAQAKTSKHHHAAASSASADMAAKVDTLTETVSALEQRLNDQSAAQQATEQRAEAAEAKADAAEADAQAAHEQLQTQIATIPGEVQTQVAAAAPKSKSGWWDNTKVGGTVFVDFSDINQSPSPNKINGAGGDIKRAYISIDHTFSDIYSANLTVDLAPNGIVLNGATFGTGSVQGGEAVKYAYVQAKYDPALIIQVGEEKTPWIPFVEDIYGYRFVDKVMVDENKFGQSSDAGINVHGDLGSGLFDYSVSVDDGAGYKTPERSNAVSFEGRANVNYMGFVGAIGGFSGTEGSDIQGGPVTQTASRWDALLAYTNSQLRLGVEYFDATDFKTVAGSLAVAAVGPTKVTGPCTVGGVSETCTVETSAGSAAVAAVNPKADSAEGWSFFGSYIFLPQWSVFGRYDYVNPSEKLAASERYTFYNIGLDYTPMTGLDLALVYRHEDIANAAKGGYATFTTTLDPGSTGAGVLNRSGSFDEFGVYAGYKF